MIAPQKETKKGTSGRRPAAPIKWHGGKHYLAARILDEMPDHTHYVETHFGAGAVLFRKPAAHIVGHSEVINDVDLELTNFWHVLQTEKDFARFKRAVECIPFSKIEWDRAVVCSSEDSVDRAAAFFVKYRQSRQGLGRDFATMSRSRTRRGMNEQASSWWSAVEGLAEAHERLKCVVIYSEDAADVIPREDTRQTLFYCDPPYVAGTRAVANAYQCEMSDDDHVRLLESLAQVSGKFILSGYCHPLYDSYARKHGWRRSDIQIDNKASGQKTKPIKTECLWMNY